MEIKIGGQSATSISSRTERLSCLIWGRSGTGKTVLASTAPSEILWLNFDPDGVASLRRNEGIHVVDFSNMPHTLVPNWKSGESIEAQLRSALKANESLRTVVVDSVTSFAQLALAHAVLSGKANGGSFKASMETPGMQGYGIRNRLVLDAINMLLRVTGELNRHIIFICHEDAPSKDSQGAIVSITLLLGGTLVEEVPLKISEVWHLADNDGKRVIGIRPYGARSPMRTRMFRHDGKVTNFPFTYNQDREEQGGSNGKSDARSNGTGEAELRKATVGIARWYDDWTSAGFSKIAVPTG